MFKRTILIAATWLFAATAALAQAPQLSPGQVLGNDTSATRGGRAAAIKSILDRASIANGGAAGNLHTYFNGAGLWDVNVDTTGFVRSSDHYEENNTTDHAFTLRARTNVALSYSVPTFRSSKPNSPTALDIWPSGPTPVEAGGNGFTWVDACSADLQVNELNPTGCARIGMTSAGATIGMVNFNGAPALPIQFIVGSGLGTAIKASINTSGQFIVGLGTDTPVFSSALSIVNPVTANPAISVRDSVNHSEFFATASTSIFMGAATNHPLILRVNNADRQTLDTSGNAILTGAGSSAFAVGPNGSTNPAFAVNAATGSMVAGLKLTGAATGGTVALVATDSGANTSVSLNAKGTGNIIFNDASTGFVKLGPGADTPIFAPLLYLSNNGQTTMTIRNSTNDVEMFFLSDVANGYFGMATASNLVLRTSNTDRVTINATSGGVGVGTSSDPGAGMIYTNAATFMNRTKTSWTNGAAAAAGTIANAPTAGNPTKWIPVDDNGTTRFIPAW